MHKANIKETKYSSEEEQNLSEIALIGEGFKNKTLKNLSIGNRILKLHRIT